MSKLLLSTILLFASQSFAGLYCESSHGRTSNLVVNGYRSQTFSSQALCERVIELYRKPGVGYKQCSCDSAKMYCKGQYETAFSTNSSCHEVRNGLMTLDKE